MTLALRQTGALAWRSVRGTLRTPQALFPSLIFPLILMAIFTGSFGTAPGTIPGFPPVRGFLDFALAGAIVQGILIGGTSAGAAFALDIEGGFFDRLVASPVSRLAILTGRLGGGVALAMAQAVLFLSVGIIFGARVEGGVAGVLILLVLAALMAVAVSGLGILPGAAHRLGRGRPGDLPPLLRAAVLLLGVLPPRDHDRLVQGRRRRQPDLLPGRGDAGPGDRGHRAPSHPDRAGGRARAGRRRGRGELPGVPAAAGGVVVRHALEVSAGLAWRSLILVRRMPSVFLPSLVMPLFILVATSGAFRGISLLPAFDGASYLAFTIPLALVMGAGFAGMNAGMTLARDIEGGFVNRLIVSPAPRITLIAGPLMAAALRSVFTTTVVLIAGLIGGVGLPGAVDTIALYLLGIAFAAASACWAMGVALRTRTIQAAPLMQVVIFLAVFTSVAYAPRDVLTGWLATVADLNPVTYLLEASRAAELTGLGWSELWPALVALSALLALLGTWAVTGLATLGRR